MAPVDIQEDASACLAVHMAMVALCSTEVEYTGARDVDEEGKPVGAEPARQVTRLLKSYREGEEGALEELMEVVYQDLRRIAGRHFQRERPGHTLQPTALVHEVYARLADMDAIDWKSRNHFFAVASRMMRRLLINHARDRQAGKRRGVHVELEENHAVAEAPGVDVLALDEALEKLQADHPREAQVVELRFFGGMTNEEIADVLDVGVATVKRDWTFARSWLLGVLRGGLSP